MAIWNIGGKVTRNEIEEVLQRKKKLSSTTVLSLLTRLENKGFVTVEKRGKYNVYTPLVLKGDYLQSESKKILDKMYQSSVKNFMMALYSEKKPSKKQIKELQEYIDELKNGEQ